MVIFKIVIFILGSIGLVIYFRRVLRDPHTHGFYRFFIFEAILMLFLMNVEFWFIRPFSLSQILSWICLVISVVLVISGIRLLKKAGKPDPERQGEGLISMEKTTQLVTEGIFRYIRHPMYSSLLFLDWGIFLKNLSWVGTGICLVATLFLIIICKVEESENIRYFGSSYEDYMKKTKRLIPFIF